MLTNTAYRERQLSASRGKAITSRWRVSVNGEPTNQAPIVARTKSEARAILKRSLGAEWHMGSLPVGTTLERLVA